jgi:preprotein translocase subunit SecA
MTGLAVTRLVGTLEFRLGESLGLNTAELQALPWDEVAARVEEAVGRGLTGRRERLLGADGQIVRDLEAALERLPDTSDEQSRLRLLALTAQGARTYFDAKTHRQMRQVFTRLNYIFLAGELLQNTPAATLEEDIIEHLRQAREAQSRTWGQSELTRLGDQARASTSEEIGRDILNQIYRQALLGAITELWVDYLTRVEALRVSIGLEAYAQRDPLVQYKSRASEMFQTLLADIRGAVVSRVFRYQPRPATAQQTEAAPEKPAAAPAQDQGSGKKRKRHRH